MPEVKILNHNNINLTKTVKYEFGDETLASIIAQYDSSFKKENSNISIGGEIIQDWNMPISVGLHYGDFISLYCYNVKLRVRLGDQEREIIMDSRKSIKGRHKIFSLKENVCALFNIEKSHVKLTINGKSLESRLLFLNSIIEDVVTVCVEDVPISLYFKIYIASLDVKLDNQGRLKIDQVYPSETIINIKRRLASIINLPVEFIKLEYRTIELEDDKSVLLLKIQGDLNVYLKRNSKIGTFVTIKALDGEIFSVAVTESTKIKDINDCANTASLYYDFKFGKVMLQDDRAIAEYGLLENKIPIYYKKSIIVYVRSAGKCITITSGVETTIKEIKMMIQDEEGMSPDNFKLMCSGRILEDSRTLDDYNIFNDRIIIHLNFQVRGGGFNFVDLRKNPQISQWSKNAPKWRIVRQGLCFEGKCTNRTCVAFNKMVIINMSFTIAYQLGLPNQKPTNCPMCNHYVKPVTCAFNNCEWRFLGIKDTSNGPEKIKSEWKEVGDEYHRFNEQEQSHWNSLAIETRHNDSNDWVNITALPCCAICILEEHNSNIGPSNFIECDTCKGKMHSICVSKLKMIRDDCPLCIGKSVGCILF